MAKRLHTQLAKFNFLPRQRKEHKNQKAKHRPGTSPSLRQVNELVKNMTKQTTRYPFISMFMCCLGS